MGRLKPFAQNVRWKFGAWRYRVPKWLTEEQRKELFDGKQEITLGKNQAEALLVYAKIINKLSEKENQPINQELPIITISDLINKYLAIVVPTKGKTTRENNLASIERIKKVFANVKVEGFKSAWVYRYRDETVKKYASERYDFKKSTNNDLELLSHMFSKAIEWGAINNDEHPMRGLRIKFSLGDRDRYVEDWELKEFLSVCSPFIKAYVGLKSVLGLRKSDMMRLKVSNIKEEGLYSINNKNGKKTLYKWTEERRKALDECLRVRPKESEYIFCTRKGTSYYLEHSEDTSGFDSIWQRYMKKALEQTKLSESFTEHDIRAKVASDSDDDEQARKRLGHKSITTTRKVYRRKPEQAD